MDIEQAKALIPGLEAQIQALEAASLQIGDQSGFHAVGQYMFQASKELEKALQEIKKIVDAH